MILFWVHFQENEQVYNSRSHVGTSPLHWPLLRHSVSAAPDISYPGKQENCTTLPYVNMSPSFEPDMGAEISGHPTAVAQDKASN